ncbi:MAG TPA: cysteine--tRNA ligase [Solirubrobacteraceae bacterium]
MRLHDTLTGEIRELTLETPPRVRMYACGPTVYGRVHVGNARPFVVFSQFKRFLIHEGYDAVFVGNITDINDKIYVAARQAGVPSEVLAEQMTAAYKSDTDVFGFGRPDAEPLASETIPGIVGLIEELVERGHAYAADGDVYFSVRSYPEYGELSHRDIDQMDQGDEVEGAARKRDPVDFALWKAHKETEDTCWDSPWGPGRPGWHIECSAMAEELLGVGFEVHGGGSDLIFPHHENEAAQTRAARDRELTRLWMHVGLVRLDSEKMSKSVGNVFMLGEALERHGPETLLMYFSGAHYRQPMEYDEDRLAEAQKRAAGIRNTARGLVDGPSPPWSGPLTERFFDALANDFNAPRALAVLSEWEREANRSAAGTVGRDDLREMLDVLGLAGVVTDTLVPVPDEARALLEARERARTAREWAQADRLRDELRGLGWEVRDGPDGPELVPAP